MKNISLFLILIFGINSAFAQYEYSEITGIYNGYLHQLGQGKDASTDWQITISDNYLITLKAKVNDIWITEFSEESKTTGVNVKKDGVYFDFKLPENAEYRSLILSIQSERFKENAKMEGIYIALFDSAGNMINFDMNREGGNPVLKSPQIAKKYEGQTATWGSYKVNYYPEPQEGIIEYGKVINKFYYKNEEGIYTIIGKIGEDNFMKLMYQHDKARKTFKLLSAPKLSPSFFDNTAIFKQLNSSKYIGENTNLHSLIAELLYELINKRLKSNSIQPTDNVIFLLNESVYIGRFDNRKIQGKGKIFYDVEIHEGNFVNNQKDGTFNLTLEDGKAIAHFDNGKKTGTWKMTYSTGDIQEIVFEADKKISSKIIKNPKRAVKHDLGISVEQNNDGDKLYVSSVDKNSAIYKAGMRQGDSFYSINGVKVSKMKRATAQEKLTYSSTDYFELEFFAKVWDKRMIVKIFPKTNTYEKVKTTAKNLIMHQSNLKKDAENTFSEYVAIDEKIANSMNSNKLEHSSLAEMKSDIRTVNNSIEKLQQKHIDLQAELEEKYKAAAKTDCKWLIKYLKQAMKSNQEAVQYLNGSILNFTHATTFTTKEEARNYMFGAMDEFAFAKGAIQNLKKFTANANYVTCR